VKRPLAFLLGLVACGSLAWVAIPVVLIRPFAAQTAGGLALAYALRARAPFLTLLLLAAGGAAAGFLWPRLISRRGRAIAGLAVAALAGCAWFARQNHFEWMFRPLPGPAFAEAGEAKHVADDDLVLGVVSGEEARVYPVRALAYHHVVNDVVGGVPIVATY
jgi:hypothetical protein